MRIINISFINIVVFCLLSFSSIASATNVTFLAPSTSTNQFWQHVVNFTDAAAKNLDIDLNVYYSKNYLTQLTMLQSIANSENKPDYVIFMPFGGSVSTSFNILNQAKIPFVTLGRVYSHKELSIVGKPQEKYGFWLGEMYYQNAINGHLLAKYLVSQAQLNSTDENHLAIGIKGDNYTASKEKSQGLSLAVAGHKKVKINQVITGNWSRVIAKQRLTNAFARHGESKIIWATSDEMALGAIDAIESMKLDPKDFYIGGFDWLPKAITAIEQGTMKASIGGNFLQGAWSLVRIYDHALGNNAFVAGDETDYVKLKLMTLENVKKYKTLTVDARFSDIDYSLFSISKTNEKTYDFDIDKVLAQLR